MLSDELDAVRRDLRRTIRAYAARLELDLAESIVAVTRHKGAEDLSRKGRRKDVRKLDSLIRDLHSIARPNDDHSDPK